MKLSEDYHTHTNYSHGKNTIEEMVRSAISAGLSGIYITEHGHAHHTFRKPPSAYYEMRSEIDRLKNIYPINIIFGVEANIISTEGDIELDSELIKVFDVINVGFHMMIKMKNLTSYRKITLPAIISQKLGIRYLDEIHKITCTRALIMALERYKIFMVTHPTSYYPIDVMAVAEVCEKTGTLLEINNSRGRLTKDDLILLKDRKVQFAIGSDAHSVTQTGSFERSLNIILESGIDLSRVVNLNT
jgi:putative hydrolase